MRTVLFALLAVVGISLAGCGLSDPPTDVPKPIREKLQTPPQVPASKVAALMRDYQDQVTEEARAKAADNAKWARSKARELRDLTETIAQEGEERDADAKAVLDRGTAALAQFQANQKDAQARADAFAGKLWSGIDMVAGQVGSLFPGAGLVLPLVTGLAGLFLPRPGEKKTTDLAYDQGVNAGLLMDRDRVPAAHPTPDLLPTQTVVLPAKST